MKILKDNKIFVFFSASGTGSEYCMGRLSIESDAEEKKKCVLSFVKQLAPQQVENENNNQKQ